MSGPSFIVARVATPVFLVISGCVGDSTLIGDPGSTPPDPDAPVRVCEQLDVLFAIDSGSGMVEEIEGIRSELFPLLMSSLPAIGTGIQDFRVATVDDCTRPATFHTAGDRTGCAYPTLLDGVGECEFESAAAWISAAPDRAQTEMCCVSRVDRVASSCDGDFSGSPSSAAAAALADPANDGFLREAAVLVVFVVTNRDENLGDDELRAIRDRILGNKPLGPEQVLFVGIGGSRECDGPYGFADEARDLQDLVDSIDSAGGMGLFWDLCAGTMSSQFSTFLSELVATCGSQPLI